MFPSDPSVTVWDVLPCYPGVYCCRPEGDFSNCCNNQTALVTRDLGTLILPQSTQSASSSGMATGTTSTLASMSVPTTSGSMTAGPNTKYGCGCPSGPSAAVGGAVGGVLGAGLLLSLGVIATMGLRRSKDNGSGAQASTKIPRATYSHELPDNSNPAWEAEGQSMRTYQARQL